jgi:hypothetical protein
MADLFAQKNSEIGKKNTPTDLKIPPKNAKGAIHKKAIHVSSGDLATVHKMLHGGNVKKG